MRACDLRKLIETIVTIKAVLVAELNSVEDIYDWGS